MGDPAAWEADEKMPVTVTHSADFFTHNDSTTDIARRLPA